MLLRVPATPHANQKKQTNCLYSLVEVSDVLVILAERIRLMLYLNIVSQCLFDNKNLQASYFTNQRLSNIAKMNPTYLQ